MRKILALSVLMFVFSGLSMAWNCSVPGEVRVQVPASFKGNGTGDGDGQVVTSDGLNFVCEKLPTADPSPVNIKNSSNSNSSATSSSTSGAVSSSTAQGGSVKNSGNSSNKNTNVAEGGQGGNASQSSTNTANSNGDNSNNYSNTDNFKIAAASAIAPTSISTAPCLAAFGAGAQSIPGGVSFGGSRVDKGCDDRQTAILFISMHNLSAAAKVLCATKAAKRAKLTMDDCMAFVLPPAPVIVQAPAPVVTPTPAPVVVPESHMEVFIVPIPREEMTVTATKQQIKATAKKSVVRKKADCKVGSGS